MPLAWEDLSAGTRANHFTAENVPARFAHLREDPWAEMAGLKQTLP